ncbi:MAG: sulfatase-like hydrolase/transferase [Acidobacteria bacterium]|nr:sulfatase-like hydrolase/transferase [Acidobacteriota bacterium]
MPDTPRVPGLDRRTFLSAAAGGLAASLASGRLQGQSRRPNILFVMTDQQRYDSLGANGNELVRTPNLDRLAGQSANFHRCYVQAPVCVPSRITWFTGRYPHSHRNRVNYTPLHADEVLIQQRLRDAGYRTASVGKLHFWPPTAEHARQTGFEKVLLHDGVPPLDGQSDYVRWRKASDPDAAVFQHRALVSPAEPGKNPYKARIADEFHETTWTGLETRRLLGELAAGEHPFFLFSSFFQPHSPFYSPEPFDSLYDDVEFPLAEPTTREEIERLPAPLASLILRGKPVHDVDRERLQWAWRSYHAAIAQIDREVGLLLDALEESGQADNTIVVFSTDHGDQMLEHGLMGKNCFFESSIRLPFLLRYPAKVRPGDYQEMIETTDLLPTLFELAGLREPYSCQGRSFAGLVTGGRYEARDAVFSENIIPEVITSGSLDFEFRKGKGVKGVRHPDAKMIRTERWKLVRYGGGEGELYDMHADPGERRNLYADPGSQAVVRELEDRILTWLMTVDETDQIAPRWQEL